MSNALLFGYNPFGNSSQPFVGQLNKFKLNGKSVQYRIHELDKESIDYRCLGFMTTGLSNLTLPMTTDLEQVNTTQREHNL